MQTPHACDSKASFSRFHIRIPQHTYRVKLISQGTIKKKWLCCNGNQTIYIASQNEVLR